RGHRWLAMLESGKYPSLRALAEHEGIDNSYVSRMINLTTLAPDIVEAILDESLPEHITQFDLASGTPLCWEEQRAKIYQKT
ncbi:MAG: LacI family transcriptional regulator, partial [Oxalobacteraceae bacterium]|nr:LacI family transcriptional regulator [Oxalobacteraceae bacterium]